MELRKRSKAIYSIELELRRRAKAIARVAAKQHSKNFAKHKILLNKIILNFVKFREKIKSLIFGNNFGKFPKKFAKFCNNLELYMQNLGILVFK